MGAIASLARRLRVEMPVTQALALEGWAHRDRQFGTHLEKRAVLLLEDVRDKALLEGICCECRIVHGNPPAGEILRIAEEDGCDLIFMGAGGGSAPVSGDTLELIAASPVPVLLHRELRRGAA